MNHIFSAVPDIKVPRSLFHRNHNLKTTIGTDFLYPIYVDEALPADTFKCKQHIFGRLTTPLTPIMDNIYLDTFYFAVPIRLIWDDFLKFMGERPFGDDTTVYSVPQLSVDGGVPHYSLSDYLGIPPEVTCTFSTLWHRAYNLIYNTWFRDENLCAPVPVGNRTETSTSHQESIDDYHLRRRGKRHDYFTSCLPWPQKGEQPAIGVVGGIFPVSAAQDMSIYLHNSGPSAIASGANISTGASIAVDANSAAFKVSANNTHLLFPKSIAQANLSVDLRNLGAVSINALREAFAIQHYLERLALGGSRYIEQIRAMFGVVSPDARMQRPEYLGGCSVPLNVTSVPQTSATDDVTPQGNLAAFVTAKSDCGWSKSFTEHCVIIGLANIRADLSYSQGLPRMFSRTTKYDFYFPQLANLGEQAVLNKEIFLSGNSSTDNDVFGYQERWAEYRYHPNMISGGFRPLSYNEEPADGYTSLEYWHLAQKFESTPTLSSTFIEEHVPIARTIADNSNHHTTFLLDGWFEVKCARPMPIYSVPGLKRL